MFRVSYNAKVIHDTIVDFDLVACLTWILFAQISKPLLAFWITVSTAFEIAFRVLLHSCRFCFENAEVDLRSLALSARHL